MSNKILTLTATVITSIGFLVPMTAHAETYTNVPTAGEVKVDKVITHAVPEVEQTIPDNETIKEARDREAKERAAKAAEAKAKADAEAKAKADAEQAAKAAAAKAEQEKQAQAAQSNQSTVTYTSNISDTEQSAKEWIANKESGGSYTAVNGRFYGRYQLDKQYLHGDLSAANQEKTVDNYVRNRYGNWIQAKSHWLKFSWY